MGDLFGGYADGAVAAAGDGNDIVLIDEAFGTGGTTLGQAFAVEDYELYLLTQQAAGGIDFIDGDIHGVAVGFAGDNRARGGEGGEGTDANWVIGHVAGRHAGVRALFFDCMGGGRRGGGAGRDQKGQNRCCKQTEGLAGR